MSQKKRGKNSKTPPAGGFRRGQRQRGQGGQIAIFVVLIFQVLFVFFAFALNVALVVHDKINLQNSLDLAALYGAQKQAEVLNVLGHINFQMRQNFKLLTFRYRVLGSLTYHEGASPENKEFWCPYAIPPPSPPSSERANIIKYCHRSRIDNIPAAGGAIASDGFANIAIPPGGSFRPCDSSPYGPDYCDANYFVCVSAAIWHGRGNTMDTTTNHCKHLGTTLQAVVPFPVLAGPLPDLTEELLNRNLALGEELAAKCKYEGIYNWLTTQMFLGHFRLDQKDRKSMIREIYNKTLKRGRDLDGNLILAGARKTFKKNLTYTNRKNFSEDSLLTGFNSPDGKSFTDFFTSINVYPVLEYLDFPKAADVDSTNNSSSACGESERRAHYNPPELMPAFSPPPTGLPAMYGTFIDDWSWLFAISTSSPPFGNPSPTPPLIFPEKESPYVPMALGYERTDNLFYYGLSVTLEYSTAYPLFFPGLAGGGGGGPALKASSFAKPFGGRIGPKYSEGEQDDLIKPIWIDDSNKSNFQSGHPWRLKPNYSRYPGDKWGLIHRDVHEKYYLRQLSSTINSPPDPWPFDIIYFSHLYGGDPLAYDRRVNPEHKFFLRMMELMAVAPDLYDLTYYSPLNQYMTAYFPRICHLLGSDCSAGNKAISFGKVSYGGAGGVDVYLRGDFGFPYTADYGKDNKSNFGAKAPSSPLSPFSFNLGKSGFRDTHIGASGPNQFINLQHRAGEPAPWLAKDPAHFLTAWAPVTAMERYDNYSFPGEIFRKCHGVAEDDEPIPTGCAEGGRSGYSVKLISCEAAEGLKPAPPADFCS